QVFKHLERLAAVANLSEANRVAYDKAVDRFYVSRIYEEDMQNKVEDAMREGREEGKKEGKKEAKLEDAQNFKRLGVPADIIAKATGLSAEEIAKL
ncbi:hypothetical protein H9625_16470, partial [Phocaeicola sp. Sa1CVN1]|nr:hypothetical protein [Phocaeicola intestinalis]